MLLLGVAIYSIASALGVQRSELFAYFLESMLLVIASVLTALILFGISRLFRRKP